MKQIIGLHNYETATTPGMDTQHVVTADREFANVFFDGTKNNYFNVTSTNKRAGQESYENDLSNVARMWASIRRDEIYNAVYIEGIGTTRDKDDSTEGYALATGGTGIVARVHSVFPQITGTVLRNSPKKALPHILDINVFGFSRGAAAARHFVHLVNTQKELFGGAWQAVIIRINFVGLFDTVSSMGLHHARNVQELHLNFEPRYAIKVFHLVALDDYRNNFALTTIASAVKAPSRGGGTKRMGYELAIPGAHSDVGGGYNAVEVEERAFEPGLEHQVLEQGWFVQSEKRDQFGPHTVYRRKVSNEYYKVGLALMVDMAHRYTVTEYPPALLTPPANPAVATIRETLRAVAKEEKETRWALNDKLGADKARAVRHAFLHLSFGHMSAVAEVGHNPRTNDVGMLERHYFQG